MKMFQCDLYSAQTLKFTEILNTATGVIPGGQKLNLGLTVTVKLRGLLTVKSEVKGFIKLDF